MSDAESESKVLIVEGKDDKHVILHIAQRTKLNLAWEDIIDKNGVDRLIPSMTSEVKVPGRAAIGFILDADERPRDRWKSIVDCFDKIRVMLPDTPNRCGTIISEAPERGMPRIGVWLMPDNNLACRGELEDFVKCMIPENDPIFPLAESFIESINEEDRVFRSHKKSKAEVHAWLATRKEPGPMGLAIQRKDLDINGELCKRFVSWINCLFE